MLILLFSYACVAYIIARAEVFQKIKRPLGIDDNAMPYTWYAKIAQELLNCSLCVGFWVGIIMTQVVWQAAIVSVVAEIIDKIIG
jgi:hypothetical protein